MTKRTPQYRPGTPDFIALCEVVRAAAGEARRREQHDFDGLLGRLPDDAAGLLQRSLARIRDYLIAEYGEVDARAAVRTHLTPRGFAASSAAEVVLLDIFADIAIAAMPGMVTERSSPEAAKLADEAGLDRESLLFGRSGRATRRGRRAGGKQRGEAATRKAEVRHAEWCADGLQLRKAGIAVHNVASILARRKQVNDKTMRAALVKGGVIPSRKKTEIS